MSDRMAVNEAMLETAVNAVGAGHDLGGFEAVADALRQAQGAGGYQAKCRDCGKTAWVGVDGLMYSLLGDSCGG